MKFGRRDPSVERCPSGRATAFGGPRRGVPFVEASFPERGEITTGWHATITRIATAEPLVALTFDDGPHPTLTPQLLDILPVNQVRATFYLIGSSVAHHAATGRAHRRGGPRDRQPHLVAPQPPRPFGCGAPRPGGSHERRRDQRHGPDAGHAPPALRRHLHPRQRLMLHQARGMPTVVWSVDPRTGAARAATWSRSGSCRSAIRAPWCSPMTSTAAPCARCLRRSRACARAASAS
jgi:peptidoglycan-N-acetylglucosamine deacetylase